LSRAWHGAWPVDGTLGAAVVGGAVEIADGDGATTATVGAALAVVAGVSAGVDVAEGATGIEGVLGAGVPTLADAAELAGVALGTTVMLLAEHDASSTITARTQMRRTRRG
jgi:hypothetical protein